MIRRLDDGGRREATRQDRKDQDRQVKCETGISPLAQSCRNRKNDGCRTHQPREAEKGRKVEGIRIQPDEISSRSSSRIRQPERGRSQANLSDSRGHEVLGQWHPHAVQGVGQERRDCGKWKRRALREPQAWAPSAGDRVKKNVAPLPGADSAQIRPSCRRTMRSTIANPIPVPGYSAP